MAHGVVFGAKRDAEYTAVAGRDRCPAGSKGAQSRYDQVRATRPEAARTTQRKEMIMGMMIPVIFYGCNLRFYEVAFIGIKYGQPIYINY